MYHLRLLFEGITVLIIDFLFQKSSIWCNQKFKVIYLKTVDKIPVEEIVKELEPRDCADQNTANSNQCICERWFY